MKFQRIATIRAAAVRFLRQNVVLFLPDQRMALVVYHLWLTLVAPAQAADAVQWRLNRSVEQGEWILPSHQC